ncbi:MAG: hypothetical protein RL653_2092 [Pseudomonadota bacterium]|jgi:hypothetical protein
MRTAALALLLLLPCALPVRAEDASAVPSAQPRAVVARASPDKVLLGEPFTLEITLTHLPAERYELVAPGDLGAFEFEGQERSRTEGEGSATTTFRVKLLLFELGVQDIPPLAFDVATPEGPRRFVHSGTQVEGVSAQPQAGQADAEALRDIKPLEEVPVRSWALLYALLAGVAVAALAWAAWRWWTQRPRVPVAPVLPPRPLDERTLAALEALRREGLAEAGRSREFYFQLSAIVRGYLGERYGFEALECTSHELLARARRLDAPGLAYEPFARFVEDSDQARYARAVIPPDTCAGALQFAVQLVRDTTPHAAPRPPVP